MSKPLEPTDEQLREIANAINNGLGDDPLSDARVAWPLIRDLVLKEAERRLDAIDTEDERSFMGTRVIRVCNLDQAMEAIRAMKGARG